MLFFVPNLLLVVGEGTVWIADKAPHFSHIANALLIALLFAHPVAMTGQALLRPRCPDDIKPSILYIRSNERGGDSWYIYHFARYQFWYYAERLKLPVENVWIGVDCDSDSRCYAADLDKLRGRPRVWLLFSHIWIGNGMDEEQFFLHHLDGMGRRLDSYKSTGARAYLYDFSSRNTAAPSR